MKLLIVEDEPDLAEALCTFFQKNNFNAEAVHDGQTGLEYAETGVYDAIILDIMLPKLNGVEVLRRLRAEGINTPVMLLTAKGEKDDRVSGFNAGADDYLPKPFAPDELLARLHAMLRRGDSYREDIARCFGIELDPNSRELIYGERKTRLSAREYGVMELFMRSPGVVFSADTIMDRVWGWDSEAEINVIWVHISNLRKKLKDLNAPAQIKVSRGLGYYLTEDVKKA